jgi:hypothetical protein
MTVDDELIGRLEDYLDGFDGETPLPERVRDAIRATVPAIRQVPTGRRPFDRSGLASGASAGRWALVAAGFLVAVIVGSALLVGNRGRGVAASPGPATPLPTPVATDPFPASAPYLKNSPNGPCVVGGSGTACVEPGTYRLDAGVSPIGASIQTPRGWFEWDPGSGTTGVLVDHGDAPGGTGWGILFSSFGQVSVDPCDARRGFVPGVHTAAQLVAAMQLWPGFTVSPPQSISIDGHAGLLVEISSSKDLVSCSVSALWVTPTGTTVDAYPLVAQAAPRTVQYRILELAGKLLIIRSTDYAQTSPFEEEQGIAPNPTRHVEDQPGLRAILDSLRFAPSP